MFVSQGGAACHTKESLRDLFEILIVTGPAICWVLINVIFPLPSPYGFGFGGGGGVDVIKPPLESQAEIYAREKIKIQLKKYFSISLNFIPELFFTIYLIYMIK